MQYLIFSDEATATSAVAAIDAAARSLFPPSLIDADGSLIGVRGGHPDLSAARTVTWDVPQQRLDGKWVVQHPANLSTSSDPAGNSGMTIAQFLIAGLGTVAIETYDALWFPLPQRDR